MHSANKEWRDSIMTKEIGRRDFLKAAAAGAAGFAAASVFGGAAAFAEEDKGKGALQNSASKNKSTSWVQKGLGWCFRLR